MPAWQAAPATAAFAAFLALYPALALAAARGLIRIRAPRAFPIQLLAALPACWTLSEWLRGVVLTGFPWLATGYAHADGPLAGYAPLAGVYGVTLIAALIAALFAALLAALILCGVAATGARRARHYRAAGAGAAAIAALLAAGAALRTVEWTQPAGAPIQVRLVQGNVPQDEKFADGGLQMAIDTFGPLMNRPGRFDLVVLPESVFPAPLDDLPENVVQSLRDFTRDSGAALIFGIFIEPQRDRYFNSAVALRPGADGVLRYSKRHLVPFGEFIPWGFRWFVDAMRIPIGDQQRGADHQKPFELAGQRIAMNICFEDLFGAEIRAAWNDPAQAPTLLANISNLAWFDDSRALPQHLQISRMRALETGRPLLRATNTGATALIEADGRVSAVLPFLTAQTLDAAVQGRSGTTPFIRWGNAPALAACALLAAAAWLVAQRRLKADQPVSP
jgi:apolipoprotein N-acyltransferase